MEWDSVKDFLMSCGSELEVIDLSYSACDCGDG